MNINETLKHYFGYDSLRPGQQELIEGILQRKDVLGIMPTGAGKSLCYQVPALMLDGITIVVYFSDDRPGKGVKSGRCACGVY